MFKFLHAADLHLDSPMRMLERYEGAPAQELRAATRQALVNLVDLAIDEEVDFVLIAGDLYDRDWLDYNTGLFFVRQVNKLREASIPVYLIRGNHDAANRMTKSLPWPDNTCFLKEKHPETIRIEDKGIAIHGQGFETAAVLTDLAANYPDPIPGFFNIGMLHTSLDGREGHDPYAPCKLEFLRQRGYDYWALGHIHQRETPSEGPLVVFPGNTQGRNIRETGAKGCVLVTVSDARTVECEFRPLDVARWHRLQVDLSDVTHEDVALEQIRDTLLRAQEDADGRILVTRIELLDLADVQLDTDRWTNSIRSLGLEFGERLWIEKVEYRSAIATNDDDGFTLGTGAWNALIRTLDDIQTDDDRLTVLAEPIRELIAKLPPEVQEDWPTSPKDCAAWTRHWLQSIRPLLLSRFTSQEEDRPS